MFLYYLFYKHFFKKLNGILNCLTQAVNCFNNLLVMQVPELAMKSALFDFVFYCDVLLMG